MRTKASVLSIGSCSFLFFPIDYQLPSTRKMTSAMDYVPVVLDVVSLERVDWKIFRQMLFKIKIVLDVVNLE